jgi:hypothetical protein
MRYLTEGTLSIAILALILAVWVEPINSVLREPDETNPEYTVEDFEQLKRISAEIRSSSDPLSRTIAARKFYLTYFSEQLGIATPFTGLDGLVRYLALNDADYLFIEERMLVGFPFMAAFPGDASPDQFDLVYRGADSEGARLELYRFLPAGQ